MCEKLTRMNSNIKMSSAGGKKVIPMLSHEILEVQYKELRDIWGADLIIEVPESIRKRWADINPKEELDYNFINEIKSFVLENTCEGDYVIVQGEWGMTFIIANICINNGRIALYGTTERRVVERRENGNVICERTFEHSQFRKYEIV